MKTIEFNQLPIRLPEQRTPKRPLETVSDFVVNELPDAIHAGDVARLRGICSNISETDVGDPHVALLDLKCMERAFMALNEKRPDALMNATNVRAEKLKINPALTYEDVILRNPLLEDPRFFTRQNLQKSEHLFYAVHREIELHCCSTFKMMRSLLNDQFYLGSNPPRASIVNPILDFPRSFMGPGFEEMAASMLLPVNDVTYAQKVGPGVAGGILRMHSALERLQTELPREDFASFRGYFQPDEERNAPGPSGKFSAGMYCLDECIAPAEFSAYNERKFQEIQHFPTTTAIRNQVIGQDDMRHLRNISGKRSVINVLADIEDTHPNENTDYIHKARMAIPKLMKNMRSLHYRIMLQFLPEIKSGTGGEKDIRSYVAAPIQLYTRLSDKNEGIFFHDNE